MLKIRMELLSGFDFRRIIIDIVKVYRLRNFVFS
jgi:hypothetical protein